MNDITHAHITWQTDTQGNSVPVSADFDDVYFSKSGGLAESQYVFLQGNRLSERFASLNTNDHFVIMETGFGTGLNFLATCLLWQDVAPPTARLYFVSTEKYPLTLADLQTALSVWQDDTLRPYIDALIEQYPLPIQGVHRLSFGQITLDLWLGDASQNFSAMTAQADAWFLDGFAPSKNSELWSKSVFTQLQRLSKPNATVSTFSSSGTVRRALQDIGMTVVKVKGFGHKREMITAHYTGTVQTKPTPQTALVIGAGVSGLLTAYQLTRRGIAVKLLDKTAPLSGASGNPRALFAPKLTYASDRHEQLPLVSFLYSKRLYERFNHSSNTPIFYDTGVVDFLLPHKKTHAQLTDLVNAYPDELIAPSDDNNDDYAHHTITTHLPQAGMIDPQALAKHLLSQDNIGFETFEVHELILHTDHVQALDAQGRSHMADVAVICAGFESHLLESSLFNPRKIRGQVSWVKLTNPPTTPIKYDGYCVGFDDTFLLGASFVRNDTATDVRASEHEFNHHKFCQALPNLAKRLNLDPTKLHGRASIRAQTPDYHPIVGQITNGSRLFALYGMGSKGFSFAPLCADVLACLMMGEPLPISHALLNKLSPQRPRLATPLDENS